MPSARHPRDLRGGIPPRTLPPRPRSQRPKVVLPRSTSVGILWGSHTPARSTLVACHERLAPSPGGPLGEQGAQGASRAFVPEPRARPVPPAASSLPLPPLNILLVFTPVAHGMGLLSEDGRAPDERQQTSRQRPPGELFLAAESSANENGPKWLLVALQKKIPTHNLSNPSSWPQSFFGDSENSVVKTLRNRGCSRVTPRKRSPKGYF